jgi:hypothetical protein
MLDLSVARWTNRYRLPANAANDRTRLDQVLRGAIDGALLEAALERAGLDTGAELCIRRLDAFVRLDRAEPDDALAVSWSVALADAIAERVRAGGPDVILFGSRHRALLRMACDVARGDLTQAWAWRQLGIWHEDDVVSEVRARTLVLDALAVDAAAAVGVLAEVSRLGLLEPLARGVPAAGWVRLARAALVAAGASPRVLAASATAPLAESATARDGDATLVLRLASALARTEAGSHLLRAARAAVPDAMPAMAALALLECEPALAREDDGARLLAALASRVQANTATPRAPTASRDAAERRSRVATDAGSSDSDEAPMVHERARGETVHGGLLFLLHAVVALDLPTSIADDPALELRSLRWCLHRLAVLLAGTNVDDAAALAFCGLAPGALAPSHGEDAPSDEERRALRGSVDAMCTWLRARGAARTDEDDAALLCRIIERRATVVADPAWIELRFDHAGASTEVRRAGLDLDPGWLPWLGVVVRFVYE